MNTIYNLVRKNLIRKEVKTMNKLITIATVMLFALSTTVPAEAFVSDAVRVLNAEANLSGLTDLHNMPFPVLRNALTDVVVPGTTVSWTYESGKTWKRADQYLQLTYEANLPGWGIQIYTDNTSATASPRWVEQPADPTNTRVNRPTGLVGTAATYIAVPVAWKAFPGGTNGYPVYSNGSTFTPTTNYRKYYTEPKEEAFGDPATDDYYIELYQFKSGTNLYGKYCWLIDKGSQKWQDSNNNGVVDAGEIVSDFSNSADVNTVVNYLGSSTCTFDSSGTFIFRDACVSPIYIVLAAKIAVATIKTLYKTNKLTLELYHE